MITQDEKEDMVIHTNLSYDGESLVNFQKSLSLAIEHLGDNENADSEGCRLAIYFLSELLRSSLLTDSQTNVALGRKPYRKDTDIEQIELEAAK